MAEITLYKNCKIIPEENFILKEYYGSSAIDEYLSTLASIKFTKPVFKQNGLDIEVKVQMTREESDMAVKSYYNYCSIYEQSGATTMYYFIKKKTAIAPNCVQFSLHMDVLNSFAPTDFSGEYGYFKWGKLTHITRQPKDRFKANYIYGQGTIYAPHIDEYTEKVGMENELDREPQTLSGGQKQRVAIAGILALNCDIIILDEATSMLDPEGVEEITKLIVELKYQLF